MEATKSHLRGFRLIAMFALFAVLVAACADDIDPEDPDETPVDSTPTDDPDDADANDNDDDSDDGEAASSDFDTTSTFVFLDDGQPNPDLDPASSGNDSINALTGLLLIYDRLLDVDANGDLAPGLAEDFTLEADRIELVLREGVEFQDGDPFNAEAVRANLERLEALGDNTGGLILSTVEAIDEITVVDDYTIELSLPDGIGSVPYFLALQAGMMVSPNVIGDDGSVSEPVGTGAYRVVDFAPSESVEVELWDGYWNPSPDRVAGFEVQWVTDAETRLNLVRDGQADAANIEPRQLETAENAGLEVNVTPKASYWIYHFNHSVDGLDDVRIRQAISHAIDREGIAQALAFGAGDPLYQPFPEGHTLHVDELDDLYPYDPARGRELVEEAGYGDGLTLSLQVLNISEHAPMAEALQDMLGEIGITLELNTIDSSEFTQFWDGLHDIMQGRMGARADPFQVLSQFLISDSPYQPGGSADPRIDELIDEAGQLPPGDERNELLREAVTVITETVAGLQTVTRSPTYVYQPGCVVNFVPFQGAGSENWRDISLADGCK